MMVIVMMGMGIVVVLDQLEIVEEKVWVQGRRPYLNCGYLLLQTTFTLCALQWFNYSTCIL